MISGFVKSRVMGGFIERTALASASFPWSTAGVVRAASVCSRLGSGSRDLREVAASGARLKRAWPVRSRREITFLNLETVKSAISVQSRCCGGRENEELCWDERWKIRRSILFNPAVAASWIAISSSIFRLFLSYPRHSTAISAPVDQQTTSRRREESLRELGRNGTSVKELREYKGEQLNSTTKDLEVGQCRLLHQRLRFVD